MAEKISMLIIKVDLDCHKCYDKMRKILCRLQDQERIATISYDEKSKTIAVAGPFDPMRLACRIRCKGGKVIKDIHIMGGGGGSPPPQVNNRKKNPPKGKLAPPPPEVHQSPPSPPHAPTPGRETAAMVPRDMGSAATAKQAELERPPTPVPRPAEQYPVECTIPTVEIPSWPAAPVAPCGCPCCAPCYQGYYEGCRCGCGGGGGMVYGYTAITMPPRCGYQGCRIINEEDPNAACSIM